MVLQGDDLRLQAAEALDLAGGLDLLLEEEVGGELRSQDGDVGLGRRLADVPEDPHQHGRHEQQAEEEHSSGRAPDLAKHRRAFAWEGGIS